MNKTKKMKNTTTSTGTSAATLLGVAFVILKLTDFITWSWWWVLLPFWGPIITIIIIALGAFTFYYLKKESGLKNSNTKLKARESRFEKKLRMQMEQDEQKHQP